MQPNDTPRHIQTWTEYGENRIRDRNVRSMPSQKGLHMKPARPDDIPQATHEAVQTYFGVEIRTHVLDDGRRVINAEDFHKLLAAMGYHGPKRQR